MALRAISQQKISARRYNILNSVYSGGADPYFEYTTLLLPGNGNSGAFNHQFLDSGTANSGSGFPITRNGNATQGTFSPFSQTGWGNYFDGSSYLSLADNAAFTLGTNNFTIECWVYNGTTGVRQFLAGQTNSAGANTATSFAIRKTNTNKLSCSVCFSSTDYAATSTNDLPLNSWVHIAFVRDGNTLRQYINGVQDGTASVTGVTVNDSSNQLAIGRLGELTSDYWYGYISNFRFVNGRCVYPSGTTFDPPTSPLTRTTGGTNPPQGTECSLLTCQSNRFLDSNGPNTPASSPLTITVNGSPSVQAFSPFNPTSSWSAATNGGSGYFDGNGDYLTVPDSAAWNMGSGDFTAECWIYLTSFANEAMIMGQWSGDVGGTTLNWALMLSSGSTGYLRFITSSNGSSVLFDLSTSSTSFTLTLNTWQHIAAVRSGNTFTIYVNGVSRATTTNASSLYDATNNFTVGAESNTPTQYFTGYIGSLRLVKGTAVYTSNFTPPTAPVTNITNTSLLLNFTNAGIYDATSKNDLETVGGAQISTAQSKWGGSSMYFDGTGDWLKSPANIFIEGTEAFTVECWMNLSNVSSTKGIIVGLGSNSFGLRVGQSYLGNVNGLNIVKSGVGDLDYCSFTFATSTWYHIAVCRSGTTIYFFVNGQQQTTQGSGAGSFSFTKPTSFYVGCNNDTNENFAGYIQDLRITKGYARYTTNFTAPTAAFPTL